MTAPIPSELIGKGGVGLVMFHLARRGMEFMPTSGNSHMGDLWVKMPEGLKIFEVKTSTGSAWNVKISQAERVDYFAFVTLNEGEVWIAEKPDVVSKSTRQIGNHDRAIITRNSVEAIGHAWHKSMPPVIPSPHVRRVLPKAVPGAKGNRIVKKRLSDGTVKVYEYPPRRKLGHNRGTTNFVPR